MIIKTIMCRQKCNVPTFATNLGSGVLRLRDITQDPTYIYVYTVGIVAYTLNSPHFFNGDRMHVTLNGEPLEEVDCFKYTLGSQVAADGGCERDVVHRMNEGYKA